MPAFYNRPQLGWTVGALPNALQIMRACAVDAGLAPFVGFLQKAATCLDCWYFTRRIANYLGLCDRRRFGAVRVSLKLSYKFRRNRELQQESGAMYWQGGHTVLICRRVAGNQ